MAETIITNGQIVRPVFSTLEVHFQVLDKTGYICTMVPSPTGFELSQLDIDLGLEVDPVLLVNVEKAIEEYYA